MVAKNCKSGNKCKRRLCPFRNEQSSDIDLTNDDDKKGEGSGYDNSSRYVDTFATSTPQKKKSGECEDKSNCTYYFVTQYL